MSDQRRLGWKSGGLISTPISDFWRISTTVQDPSIPNLPLETPTAGGAYTLTAQHGTFSLSGQSVTVTRNRALTVSNGTFALSGQTADITYTPAAVNYDITAQHGTFSLSGQSVSINRNRALSPTHGTFSLSGQNATVARDRALSASHGTFALAGQDIDITYTPVTAGYELVAEHGTFSVVGRGAEFRIDRLPPPIAYWDVMAMQPQTPTKKKQRKQELETMFLLLG